MARAARVMDDGRRTQLVARWRTSGEPLSVFARRHGVHPRTFWGWCQSADDRAPRREAPAAFVPVRVVQDPSVVPAGEIEVVLTSGDRVVLRGGPIERLLVQALTTLRRAC